MNCNSKWLVTKPNHSTIIPAQGKINPAQEKINHPTYNFILAHCKATNLHCKTNYPPYKVIPPHCKAAHPPYKMDAPHCKMNHPHGRASHPHCKANHPHRKVAPNDCAQRVWKIAKHPALGLSHTRKIQNSRPPSRALALARNHSQAQERRAGQKFFASADKYYDTIILSLPPKSKLTQAACDSATPQGKQRVL